MRKETIVPKTKEPPVRLQLREYQTASFLPGTKSRSLFGESSVTWRNGSISMLSHAFVTVHRHAVLCGLILEVPLPCERALPAQGNLGVDIWSQLVELTRF